MHLCVEEESRVDVDFDELRLERTVQHEVVAKHFEAAKLLVKPILDRQEDQSHHFVDRVNDLGLEQLWRSVTPLD